MAAWTQHRVDVCVKSLFNRSRIRTTGLQESGYQMYKQQISRTPILHDRWRLWKRAVLNNYSIKYGTDVAIFVRNIHYSRGVNKQWIMAAKYSRTPYLEVHRRWQSAISTRSGTGAAAISTNCTFLMFIWTQNPEKGQTNLNKHKQAKRTAAQRSSRRAAVPTAYLNGNKFGLPQTMGQEDIMSVMHLVL